MRGEVEGGLRETKERIMNDAVTDSRLNVRQMDTMLSPETAVSRRNPQRWSTTRGSGSEGEELASVRIKVDDETR